MTNIRDQVWKILDRDATLRLNLARGLINIRAFARYCRKNGLDANDDAIISAVRRYENEPLQSDRYSRALDIIQKSRMSTRSNMSVIALVKNRQTHELLPQIYSLINFDKNEALRIVQGDESIRIMLDGINLSKVLSVVPKSLILEVRSDLAEINLHLDPEAIKIPGVGAVVLNELLANDILIYEVMTCVPEFFVIVGNAELLKAHDVLFSLCLKNDSGHP